MNEETSGEKLSLNSKKVLVVVLLSGYVFSPWFRRTGLCSEMEGTLRLQGPRHNLSWEHQEQMTLAGHSSVEELNTPEWILDYARFHDRAILSLSETKWNSTDLYKFLIYTCKGMWGGNGDRMNGIVHLYYVAMLTGRIFLIEYTRPFPLTDTLNENLIRWSLPSPPPLGKVSVINSIDHMAKSLHEPALLPSENKIISVKCNLFHPEQLWNSTSMKDYLAPFNINPTNAEVPNRLYAWGFHTLFRKSSLVQRNMDLILRPQLGLQHNGPYVAVHIRLGDQSTWSDPRRHRMSDLAAFLNCSRNMRHILKQTRVNVEPLILVTSDSNEAKQTMQASDSAVVTTSANIFHTDRSSLSNTAARAGNIAAWSEFFLLAEANCLVVSNSGFSKVPVKISISVHGRCWAKFDKCSMEEIQNNTFLIPK